MTDLALHLLPVPPSCRRGLGSPTPEATKAGLIGTAEPLHIQGEGRGLAVSRCVLWVQPANKSAEAQMP